ncbi:hypothetical protein ABWH74_002558 [Burkholderia vietnamiensis]|jgi:hypothetical protein|uniref:hypothetical protein n=1 Tax=Burkholderia TaxID=32008 RepID=UPI0010411E62|nr:hypothetical protein [Burkholderia vietnamiensis]MCA8194537.1 hypothetical protein [Burkholderia vietnamiensis]MCO1347176.1 hypothetical protein [Burkholderia vietnamiensis]MCO1428732.1 hypothetical protein [Burkholderia vietnamiensis]MDN7411592.1 hypothetical protein [Burkholderia vietnamiensis]QTK86496.1 hypothetical protein J4D21_22220 [Burkholderia vietnamiensis]
MRARPSRSNVVCELPVADHADNPARGFSVQSGSRRYCRDAIEMSMDVHARIGIELPDTNCWSIRVK